MIVPWSRNQAMFVGEDVDNLPLRPSSVLTLAFCGYCMHEPVPGDEPARDTGSAALDAANALIGKGSNAMKVSFPVEAEGRRLAGPAVMILIVRHGAEGDEGLHKLLACALPRREDSAARRWFRWKATAIG